MAFYVLIHSDSPDGIQRDFYEIKADSMVKARAEFQRKQIRQIEEYAGADDVAGQIDYIMNDETKYERVTFLDINDIQEFDYEAFKKWHTKTLQHILQQAGEEEEYREYERLKNKYEKEQN